MGPAIQTAAITKTTGKSDPAKVLTRKQPKFGFPGLGSGTVCMGFAPDSRGGLQVRSPSDDPVVATVHRDLGSGGFAEEGTGHGGDHGGGGAAENTALPFYSSSSAVGLFIFIVLGLGLIYIYLKGLAVTVKKF